MPKRGKQKNTDWFGYWGTNNCECPKYVRRSTQLVHVPTSRSSTEVARTTNRPSTPTRHVLIESRPDSQP